MQISARTYALNGGRSGARGSAGVAHGSAVEVQGGGADLTGAALAFLLLAGTQTAFGQHNLQAKTDQRECEKSRGRETLKHSKLYVVVVFGLVLFLRLNSSSRS